MIKFLHNLKDMLIIEPTALKNSIKGMEQYGFSEKAIKRILFSTYTMDHFAKLMFCPRFLLVLLLSIFLLSVINPHYSALFFAIYCLLAVLIYVSGRIITRVTLELEIRRVKRKIN